MKTNLILLLIVIGFISCSSPQKYLEESKYEKAFKHSLNNLKKNVSYEENKDILIIALKEIISRDSIELEKFRNSQSVQAKVKSISIIDNLQEKIQDANKYTGNTFSQKANALAKESELIYEEVNNAYFQSGLDNFDNYHQNKNKAQARSAHNDFLKSKQYGNINPHLDSLLSESLKLGSVIYSIEVSTGFNAFNAFEINRKIENLENYSSKFHKVYVNSSRPVKTADCKIEISFSSLDIDTKEDEDREEVEKEIKTTETSTNSEGEEIEVETTSTVKATVITKNIIKRAEWDIRINVNGSRDCKIHDTRFTESLNSKIEVVNIEGDKRAAPSNHDSGFGDELMDDDEMIEKLLDMIYGEIVDHLF